MELHSTGNLLIFFCLIIQSLALPTAIRIGALFHPLDYKQRNAFQYAVDKINSDKIILPKSKIITQIETITSLDSFRASKKVCRMLQNGVAAIFGPQSHQTSAHIQSVCDTMEIPHIEARWDHSHRRESCLVNLYPDATSLSKAFVDIVKAFNWKSFTIIYENNDGLIRLQELLKAHRQMDAIINVRQLDKGPDYRPFLKEIKNSAETHIVLDASTENINNILQQAQQIGMMGDSHNYLITSLDIQTINLENFKYGGTNITGLRLVDPDNSEISKIMYGWNQTGTIMNGNGTKLTVLEVETALIYDAVHLFAKALHDFDASQKVDIAPLSCDKEDTWQHGYSLINYMKIVEIEGLTGSIKFDHQGFRSDFVLDIVELSTNNGLRKIGTWSIVNGVNSTSTYSRQRNAQITEMIHNKTFIVTTVLSTPFVMRREVSEQLTGNAQYEGYAVDIMNELASQLGFNYTIKLAIDGQYGSLNPLTKQWNGMIKELLEQKADLAISDLTITYEREQAVDFTLPFLNLGVGILYRLPARQYPTLFWFLSPFSLNVWIYIVTVYLAVSVLLYILAQFTPDEWPHHQVSTYPAAAQNLPSTYSQCQQSIFNCLWFTISSFCQQNTDYLPKALSTRMVAATWWLFTLIVISFYTANLTAHLTVERLSVPIETVDDLARQTKISYGLNRAGSTASFFRDSNVSIYKRMWSYMESQQPSAFTTSNDEGVERVNKANGKYAFFMESTAIEYAIERHCDLIQVGGLLDSKGYGIAMPSQSSFRTNINEAILKLQEEGKLQALKTKWWKEKHGGDTCTSESVRINMAVNEFGMANVTGVFAILIGGMILACILSVCEFIWKPRKKALAAVVNRMKNHT